MMALSLREQCRTARERLARAAAKHRRTLLIIQLG